MKDHLTAQETAQLLGVSKTTVLTYLADGRFPNARKEQDRWLIPDRDIADFEPPKPDLQPVDLDRLGKGPFSLATISKKLAIPIPTLRAKLRNGEFPGACKDTTKRGHPYMIPLADLQTVYSNGRSIGNGPGYRKGFRQITTSSLLSYRPQNNAAIIEVQTLLDYLAQLPFEQVQKIIRSILKGEVT